MLIDKSEYKNSLSELWHKVFGDSYSFIELIFKPEYRESILCFAQLDGDMVVSAFYLIKNTLKFQNVLFDGYYLYAAATLPEYRKSGIMSKLIREAQNYCYENKVDFISLVPSEESLYGYYSRFGFETAMYRCENEDLLSCCISAKYDKLSDADSVLSVRSSFEGNIISFHPSSFGYAFECLSYSGFEFRSIAQDCYLLCSDEDDFSEFISSEADLDKNENKLGKTKSMVTAPFALKAFNTHKFKPFGMLYPINKKLIRNWNFTDIYMNIALD